MWAETLQKLTTGYREGDIIDELKEHFQPDTNIRCPIKRGVVIETLNGGKSAKIECECGAVVREGI